MKQQTIIYGAALAGLTVALKYITYQFVLVNNTLEVFTAIVAVLFTGLGIWVGRKMFLTQIVPNVAAVPPIAPVIASAPMLPTQTPVVAAPRQGKDAGLSKRESEILELMALGHSNQEIADKAFVSVSTVKTHVSSILCKLDVQRRTQAVNKARALGLVP